MELELAKKIEEMSFDELIKVFRQFMMEEKEAFDALKEIVDDTI